MVVPVGVVTQRAACQDRPRLGHVRALVIDQSRRPGEPDGVHEPERRQQPGDERVARDVETTTSVGDRGIGGEGSRRYGTGLQAGTIAVQLDDHDGAVRTVTGTRSRRCAPT